MAYANQANYGTGRRKAAVARVYIKAGSGNIVVNKKPLDQFFSRETGRMLVRQPLEVTESLKTFDIQVNVSPTTFSYVADSAKFRWSVPQVELFLCLNL